MKKNILQPNKRIIEPFIEIQEAIRSSNLLTAETIELGINKLISQAKEPSIKIECYASKTSTINLSKWIGANESEGNEGTHNLDLDGDQITLNYKFRYLNDHVTSQEIGSQQSLIKLIDVDYLKELNKEDWENQLIFITSEAGIIFLFSNSEIHLSEENQTTINETTVNSSTLIANNFDESQLINLLQNTNYREAINLLYNFGLCNAALSIYEVIKLSHQQEQRSIRGKKAVNNQQIIQLKNEKSTDGRELMVEIKKQLSQQSRELIAGSEEAVEKEVFSRTSKLQKLATLFGSDLQELEEVESTKETLLKIPNELKDNFIAEISNLLLNLGQVNLRMVNDGLKDAKEGLERKIDQANITSPSLPLKYLNDMKLRQLISEVAHWEKDFEGSLQKKGAYEYFMAARKFQMMLVMIASTFGLSIIRDLRAYMIPFSVLLIGFGGISIFKSIKNEREEKNKKELEKARELFRNEAKKIGTSYSRIWLKFIKTSVDFSENELHTFLENYLKNVITSEKEASENNKSKIQLQAQNIESTERKHQTMTRSIEGLSRTLGRLISECKTEFSIKIQRAER